MAANWKSQKNKNISFLGSLAFNKGNIGAWLSWTNFCKTDFVVLWKKSRIKDIYSFFMNDNRSQWILSVDLHNLKKIRKINKCTLLIAHDFHDQNNKKTKLKRWTSKRVILFWISQLSISWSLSCEKDFKIEKQKIIKRNQIWFSENNTYRFGTKNVFQHIVVAWEFFFLLSLFS